MPWLGATVLAVGFMVMIHVLRMIENTKKVMQEANQALGVVRDKSVNEIEKEKRLQAHALRLFALFFLLAVGGIMALACPVVVVWGMEQAGWLKVDDVMATVVSLEFLGTSTLVAILGMYVYRRLPRNV